MKGDLQSIEKIFARYQRKCPSCNHDTSFWIDGYEQLKMIIADIETARKDKNPLGNYVCIKCKVSYYCADVNLHMEKNPPEKDN